MGSADRARSPDAKRSALIAVTAGGGARRDMPNKDDRIALAAGPLSHAAVGEAASAYQALLALAVKAAS